MGKRHDKPPDQAFLRCPGCGASFPRIEGATHTYLTVSAECWGMFNESLALHYNEPTYWPAHQVLTDAYVLQHSRGDDPRAMRSANLHLAALYAQCALGLSHERVVDLRRAIAEERPEQAFNNWPDATKSIRDVDITGGPRRHIESAYDFAHAVCGDWKAYHTTADALCQRHLGDKLR